MISEGSCDTEDWSNDDENSALTTGINYVLKLSYSKLWKPVSAAELKKNNNKKR